MEKKEFSDFLFRNVNAKLNNLIFVGEKGMEELV